MIVKKTLLQRITRCLLSICALENYIPTSSRYTGRQAMYHNPSSMFESFDSKQYNAKQNESWQSSSNVTSCFRVARRRLKCICFYLFICILVCCFLFYLYRYVPRSRIEPIVAPTVCSFSSTLTNDTVRFGPLHHIRHFPQFICPQNFRNLADWIYGWSDQFLELVDVTTDNGTIVAPYLPNGSIIYVRIWSIDTFFSQVYPHLTNKFVLVTGEGDVSSPSHLEKLQAPDSKVIHWFGQNGQFDVAKVPQFTHIPIGINCYEMADAIYGVHSQHSQDVLPPVFHQPDEPSVYIQPYDVSRQALNTTIANDHLVLINFSPETDGSGLRKRIVEEMCSNETENKYPFIQCFTKKYGVQIPDLPKLYERNRQYPFWLSPRGNGIDCHRTWEALYLDIIPIVWNNSLTVLYENLPVLIINGIEELNEKFLREKLEEISKKKMTQSYQYEKLRNAYWRRLILDKSRHRDMNSVSKRDNQCWRAKSKTG